MKHQERTTVLSISRVSAGAARSVRLCQVMQILSATFLARNGEFNAVCRLVSLFISLLRRAKLLRLARSEQATSFEKLKFGIMYTGKCSGIHLR